MELIYNDTTKEKASKTRTKNATLTPYKQMIISTLSKKDAIGNATEKNTQIMFTNVLNEHY